MKYLMRWTERSYGSAADYEGAQSRVLALMQFWKPPESVRIQQFVVRVGNYAGYAIFETDDPVAVHQMTSTFAVFDFVVEPVLDVADALGAEGAATSWRASLG
ncbi:MAG: DUF3303 domain-containing protein [Lautropia sp.]